MKVKIIFCICFLSFFTLSCSKKKTVKGYIYKVKIEPFKGLTNFRRAYYSFSYQDSVYKGSYRFGRFDPYYLEKDSVWVIFNERNLGESELNGISFRPDRETKFILKSELSDDILYYDIAQKPLFFNAENPDDNRPKINEYVHSKIQAKNVFGKCDLTVIVTFSEMGYIEKVKISKSSGNKELDDSVTKILLSSPQGTHVERGLSGHLQCRSE